MERNLDQGGRERDGSEYADRLPDDIKASGIGDGPASDGTPEPWEDVGVGGSADFGGLGNLEGTSSMRVGNIARGGVPGSRLGSVAPHAGLDTGSSEAAQGGVDAIRDDPRSGGEARPVDGGIVDQAPVTRATQDALPDVGMPAAAALGAAGIESTEARLGSGDSGASDLGAAAGGSLGSSLGATRSSPSGNGLDQPRGTITGVGGTRGSGEGTGHLSDAGGSGGLGSGSADT